MESKNRPSKNRRRKVARWGDELARLRQFDERAYRVRRKELFDRWSGEAALFVARDDEDRFVAFLAGRDSQLGLEHAAAFRAHAAPTVRAAVLSLTASPRVARRWLEIGVRTFGAAWGEQTVLAIVERIWDARYGADGTTALWGLFELVSDRVPEAEADGLRAVITDRLSAAARSTTGS